MLETPACGAYATHSVQKNAGYEHTEADPPYQNLEPADMISCREAVQFLS